MCVSFSYLPLCTTVVAWFLVSVFFFLLLFDLYHNYYYLYISIFLFQMTSAIDKRDSPIPIIHIIASDCVLSMFYLTAVVTYHYIEYL